MHTSRISPRRRREPVRGGAQGRRLRTSTALAALLASLAAVTTVTVDFSDAGGAPGYGASGTIYGMTVDGSLPQDHFYKDIKWKLMRAGGAQLNNGGYGTSLAAYQTRWAPTLTQYRRT